MWGMPLTAPAPVDTRFLFRPISTELVTLLRGLTPADWDRPTVAGKWTVRDILAHLVDLTCRRLSFHRDGMTPPPPPRPIASERDFVEFINWLNAEWIGASKRFSPRVLTDMFEQASTGLADWFEALPLEAPALFGVSWAGEQTSEGWFDVGREFTELWHHQQQIRMAVGAPAVGDPRYLGAVIAVSVRGLPHAYRAVDAEPGATIVLDVSGPAGGQWTLTRNHERWTLSAGEPPSPSARMRLADDAAWKLLYNALPEQDAASAVVIEGRADLAKPLLRARTVIV
jgi:uncharacterized protein (TIGR03083 family)